MMNDVFHVDPENGPYNTDYAFHFGVVGTKMKAPERLFPGPGSNYFEGTWETWGEDDGHNSTHIVFVPSVDGANDVGASLPTVEKQLTMYIRGLQAAFKNPVMKALEIRLVDYCVVSTSQVWSEQLGVVLLDHLLSPLPKRMSAYTYQN